MGGETAATAANRTAPPHEPPAALRGDRVRLRPVRDEDVPRFLEIVTDPEVREWWIGYDEAGLRKEVVEDPAVTAFAIELGDRVIGIIMYNEECDPHYRYAMIDVTVDSEHLGQGHGTDALRTLARYLFSQGHHRIMIDPAVANARAIRAYEKVGFRPVGVMRRYELGPDGVWRDSLLMDLLAEELT